MRILRFLEGRVVHDGDPILAGHVLGAKAVFSERGWRLSKKKSGRWIDRCVAMVMGLWESSADEGGESEMTEAPISFL